MAQKPDGKPARVERVTFTRPAADRIAKVVRRVEQGDRGAEPLTFGRSGGSMPHRLSVATFTGNWQTGTYKTVTLAGVTNTASVFNLCTPSVGFSTANTSETRYVIFGKVKHATDPVVVEIEQRGTLQIGTTSGQWNKDTTATINGVSEIRNYWGNVAPGKRVGFQMAADGHYYLVVAEC